MSASEGLNPHQQHPERPLPTQEVIMLSDPEMVSYPELMGEIASGIADVERVSGRQVRFNTEGLQYAEAIGSLLDRHTSRGQVVVEPLILEMKNAGMLDMGSPVFLATSRDLNSQSGTNFIFGLTIEEWNVSVQSIFRHLQQEPSTEIIGQMARLIGRHEYGHLRGLDERTIRNQDGRGGLYVGHCQNECTMQQVMSVPETRSLAQRLHHKHDAGFCTDCVSVLRQDS